MTDLANLRNRIFDILTEGVVAYHGTTSDFTGFKVDDAEYMIDRALGVHFAVDPNISNSFIENRVNGRFDSAKDGGRIIRVILPDDDRFLQVPQQKYTSGAIETDQRAIEIMAAYEAFKIEPDLLARYLVQARAIPQEEAGELAHRLVSGETVRVGHDGEYTLRPYLHNVGGRPFNQPDRIRVVQISRQSWMSQGYAGLRYINTSPMEMANATNPTCYVVFPDASGNLPIQ